MKFRGINLIHIYQLRCKQIHSDCLYDCTQGHRSESRARGSKGNARALQTNDGGSKPKIGWIWAPPVENFLWPYPLDWLKILSKIF